MKIVKILNLGCGKDIMEDAINVDIVKLEGVDIVHDLNQPLPFDIRMVEGTYDKIILKDVIEHLIEPMNMMEQCYRLLKPGGILFITVVYFTHRYAWGDPQHKRAFSEVYFEHFVKGKQRDYYFNYHFSDLNVKFHYDGENIQGMQVTLTK